uniref:Uncharacterized protein n=1 Tax=Globodera rostochiensis TaxID=31243 RepID=A0A914H892_GLORO
MAGCDRSLAKAWRVEARRRLLARHEQLCQEWRAWIRRVNRSHFRRILREPRFLLSPDALRRLREEQIQREYERWRLAWVRECALRYRCLALRYVASQSHSLRR